MELKEEPRSTRRILIDSVREYSWIFYFIAFAFIGFMALMSYTILIHAFVVDIEIARLAEKEAGYKFEEKIGTGFYIDTVIITAGWIASLYTAVRERQ